MHPQSCTRDVFLLPNLPSPPDFSFLNALVVQERVLRAGDAVTLSVDSAQPILLAREGIGFGYALLEDGRRQVECLCYPGDVLGLREGLLGLGASFLEAATDMRLSVIDADRLRVWLRDSPRFEMCWMMARDAHLLSQWLASAGQRSAAEGIAWFAGHAYDRARRIGMGSVDRVPFPFRQQVIADALGLSLVHTNKTIRRLRAEGAFVIEDGFLTLPDPGRLRALARG